jgi:hypothetical protein
MILLPMSAAFRSNLDHAHDAERDLESEADWTSSHSVDDIRSRQAIHLQETERSAFVQCNADQLNSCGSDDNCRNTPHKELCQQTGGNKTVSCHSGVGVQCDIDSGEIRLCNCPGGQGPPPAGGR